MVEGQRHTILPAEDFPIQHRTIGEGIHRRLNFGELMGDQVFPSGPDEYLIRPFNHLGANAVPLPLRQPAGNIFGLKLFCVDGRRQKERIGLAGGHVQSLPGW